MSKLTLDDISDLRAYEREREEFRADVIALKKRRRVSIGPVTTFLFENRETIRFQIQEMARIEKLISDEAIEGELAAYNPLIPEPGKRPSSYGPWGARVAVGDAVHRAHQRRGPA